MLGAVSAEPVPLYEISALFIKPGPQATNLLQSYAPLHHRTQFFRVGYGLLAETSSPRAQAYVAVGRALRDATVYVSGMMYSSAEEK